MKRITVIILLSVILLLVFLRREYMIDNNNPINSGNNLSGVVHTGSIFTGTSDLIYRKEIGTGIEFRTNILSKDFYPQVKINKTVKRIKLIFDVTFTDEFKKWNTYNKSHGYYFAFRFFLGDLDSFGGFYDVFRNKNDGVSNSINGELDGAKLGYQVNDSVVWEIGGEKIKIAQPIGTYGYTFAYPKDYINSQVGKIINIGGYLSSVKEMKGRNFTKINSIIIEYEGDEDAIMPVH